MVEEHDHPSNYWQAEEGMNMTDIHMVEVEGMDMVEERPSNYRSEDEGTDMVEEHPSNHQPDVDGIDRDDIDMVEDMTVEVVERQHKGVVLARHWIGDGAERHRRTHREWEELTTSGCSEGHTTFTSRNYNCST
jgi:hypothetical protein